MFDIGWTELLVIGVVALIVVGPKDLPGMFRALGQFTGKMRRMARDFQRAMDEAADDTGVKQTASDLKSMTSAKNLGLDTLKSAADRFDKWEPPKATKPAASSKPAAPSAPMGENTAKLKENQALDAQKRLAEARAAREAKAAEAAAPEPAPAPRPAREQPGTPTARAARPKNMPKKKPARGR